jgi:transcriptional regulator with XRE-family HTH domain
MNKICIQIKRRREALAYSQLYVASKTGMTQQNYSRIESGKGDPPISVLQRIAKALECSLGELITAAEKEGSNQ